MLFVGRNEAAIVKSVRQQVADWSAPLLEWAAGPLQRVRHAGAQIGSYQYLYDEVARLKAENDSLQSWKARAIELESRVRRYEELLNARIDPAMKFVTARVLADARGPFARTMLVNAGSEHGVLEHQAVMDGRGLVGRTVTTGKEASRVLLVSDVTSRIPVRIEPHGYRAIMSGTNRAEPRLEFLPSHVSIREGDTVFTSGDGGQLPPGLPIGVVASAGPGAFKVVPYASPGRLSYVRIFHYKPSLKVDTEPLAPPAEPTTQVAVSPEDAPSAPGAPPVQESAETGSADTPETQQH